jgi:hypothetical protein
MKNSVVLFFICVILYACNNQSEGKEPVDYFYQDIGGLGYKRIQLIKPYEAKMVSDSEWRIELQTTNLLELSIKKVNKINVTDSLIFIYAKGGTSIRDTLYNEGWFVIAPSKSIENGFGNERGYLEYLKVLHKYCLLYLIRIKSIKTFEKY